MARPTSRLMLIGSSRRKTAAITITNRGTAPFRTDASVESTLCSAQVISENGMATLNAAITRRWPYVRRLRGSCSRAAATTTASSTNPTSSRSVTSVNGWRPASTPILMNR